MNRRTILTLLVLSLLLASPGISCQTIFAPRATPTPTSLPPTQPLLLERSPARGEEAPLDRPLTLYFDQAMDSDSVEAAFSIAPTVEGAFLWTDPATLVFTPATAWERATRYRVKLDPSAKSAQGLPLREEVEFTFTTVGYLEVTQVIPEPETVDVEPTASVTIMFNRPVVPLQLVSAPVAELPSPVQFDPPVEGSGTWINTSIYVFRPATGFVGGRTYRATVAAGLSDTTGGVLLDDFTWTFTIQAPYVVWTEPGDYADQVPLTQPITVTFSQPMDRQSVQEAFSLQTSAGQPVSGHFSWSDDGLVMTFTPEGRLQIETGYTARISRSARTVSSQTTLEQEHSWSFRTVRYPRIVRTDPADGATAPADTSLTVYFSAPMDMSTLGPNITILPEPTRVYTYWSEQDRAYVVSWDVQPSTSYEVRLGARMADPYGNTVGQERVIRFTTRALDPLAYLAVPGNVGTYNGYTSTYVYVTHRNVSQVDLGLYRLDWEDFARLTGPDQWQAWDRFDPRSQAELIRQWTIPTEAPLNESRYLRVDLSEQPQGSLPPGLYFLEVSAPEARQQQWWEPSRHILVVSRIHLTLKMARREALVWATDLASGAPVAGLEVRLMNPGGDSLGSGHTGADGVFRTEFEPLEDIWAPYLAFSGRPGSQDFAVISSDWYSGIGPWDFGLSTDFAPRPYRVYLHTDRPIYRPGQPVYFRGIVRLEDDAHYRLPSDLDTVSVTIYDDQGQKVYTDTLPLSDLGTFDGEFTLSGNAGLGYYFIETRIGEQTDGVGFQVAEYRRPEFQVSVTTDQDQYLAGDTIGTAVQATYFFGGPVAGARVNWSLLTQDYSFRPDVPGWWDWSDTSRWDWWQPQEVPGWGRVIAEGQGTTDAQGRLIFSVPANIAEAIFSQRFTIEATVTDVNDQSVSNRTSPIVHQGLFYIGLRPGQYVGQVGQEQVVEIRTVDWEGGPVGSVPLTVTFSQREWLNVQEEDEYGNLYWTWAPSDTVVFSRTVTTDRSGQATASFIPSDGGTYIVRAEGKDQRGNTVVSATWLWVSGREYVSWRQENNDRIQLIADQRSYQPGDVARILIPSPFQGQVTALFTVERGRVLRHWVQTLTGNAETIELPISAEYAPNVFVSVVLVKGVDETNPVPAYRVGYVSFGVSIRERELRIRVTTDRDLQAGEHYGPRETVTADLQVTDASGRPAQAEIGIAVVDKAVLSLALPNAPAIADAFYGQRGLGIRTADSLSISVDRINVQVAREAKGGGGGGLEAMGAEFIRQEFPDTAYWAPSIRTDVHGHATVSFRLPDQLTTWHLDARAVTGETLVGQAELDILSTKDLLVRPVTPRFFVMGDRADLAAVVHNNTDEALEVEVWLDAVGVGPQGQASFLDDSRRRVTIPAHDKQRVEWSVQIPAETEWADLTFHARGGGYSDAVKPPAGLPPHQWLPVYRYSTPETTGTAGQLDQAESVLEAVALPRRVDVSQGQLTVRLEPSLAAGMTGGLQYLEHYPYECTEQTVSRFLPNVMTFRALTRLGVADPELEAKLRQQVGIGLQRLYNQQHPDGGWGWWVNDQSDSLTSAYVVFGMLKARQAGFAVEEGVLEQGVIFLQGQVKPTSRLQTTSEANRQAFVLYVLAEAEAAQESHLSALYEARARLGHYGRAYLALALARLGQASDDPRIRTLLSDLASAAIVSASGAHWQEQEPERWNWNTDTRSTAIVLDALARLDADNPLASNAVRWLMRARTADRWETTQETAWALIALTDWMVATGELQGDYSWGVRLNREDLGSGRVTPDTVRDTVEFRVAVADLLLGEANRLEIARGEGPGRLYYTAHLQAYLPVQDVQALNRGLVVGRHYEMADCREDCPAVTQARVGDLVRVRLTIIAPSALHYVVIEDPFPGGLEPIDTSLQTTRVVGERPEFSRTDVEQPWWHRGWGWWWFSDTDLRDEKLVLFATSLPAGTYEYTYLLQAGLAGEYQVLPVTGYEMYFPEVMGRSDGLVFTVQR